MHAVETVRIAEKISGCPGRPTDAGEFGDAMRLNIEFQQACTIAAEIES